MICHLNSFDLSKSFKVSPAEHLLLSTWRWACQVGRRGAEVHAQFNCKLLVNQANPCKSQSDNLCETLFEPHNSCPWKIIQNSLETPREHHPLGQHANIHTITYLWPSAKGKHSQGGLFCRGKFTQLTPSQNCSATGSSELRSFTMASCADGCFRHAGVLVLYSFASSNAVSPSSSCQFDTEVKQSGSKMLKCHDSLQNC